MPLNALDYIPTGLHANILNHTSNDDVSVYLQQWLDDVSTQRQKGVCPAGKYRCDQALYVTRYDPDNPNNFATCHIVGDGGGYTNTLSQTTLEFTRLDQPALIINKARGVRIADIQITGKNVASPYPPNDVSENYQSPGVRTSQISPHCGIGIDATLGPAPSDGYPDLVYPDTLVNIGSKNLRMENVSIRGFLVGIAVSPNNTKQAEQIIIDKCSIGNCEYGYSCGQAQARACVVSNTDVEACRIGFTGNRHGKSLQGVAPIIENCQLVLVHRVFEFSDQHGSCHIKGSYCEQCNVLGTYGFGFSSTKFNLHISDCSFHFSAYEGKLPPIILETVAAALITSTQFRSNDITAPMMNFVGGGRITFQNCTFYGAWRDNKNELASVAQRQDNAPELLETHDFRNCMIVSPNDFHPLVVEDSKSKYTRTIASCSNIDVQPGIVTYTLNDASQTSEFDAGQLVMLMLVPQGKSVNRWIVPLLRISSIDSNNGNIVCDKLVADEEYDPELFNLTIRGLVSDEFT